MSCYERRALTAGAYQRYQNRAISGAPFVDMEVSLQATLPSRKGRPTPMRDNRLDEHRESNDAVERVGERRLAAAKTTLPRLLRPVP